MRVKLMSPEKGYRNDWLWLPIKRITNLTGIQNSLTYYTESGPPIKAWSITGQHLVVPREYIPFSRWGDLPFEMVDNIKTDFPQLDGVEMRTNLRDAVQLSSCTALLEGGSGLLSLACGKGKTVISLHAWSQVHTPGLVVVHTLDLENQWRDRILEHTNLSEHDIGTYRGQTTDWEKPITIASIQTLAARSSNDEIPEEFRNHFGVVLYDEVHHLGAPYFNETAAVGKGIRWGLSATPSRRDGLDMLYQYHLGPIHYTNHEQDIIPESWFIRTGAKLQPSDYPHVRDRSGEFHIPKMLTWLSDVTDRNDLICSWINDLLNEGRRPLVLSPRVEHLEALYDRYKGATTLRVGLIHGDVKGDVRHDVLNNCDLIFATQQLAKEGLDRKDLDSIVLTMPFTDESMLRQVLGRIQRPAANKKTPVVLVFEDENLKPLHEMCKKMRHQLTVLNYPFDIARTE